MTDLIRVVICMMGACASFAGAEQSASHASDFFTIDGRAAHVVIVTAPWATAPPVLPPDSLMLREIGGIAAVLDSKGIRELNRAVVPQSRVPEGLSIDRPRWTLHLANRSARGQLAYARSVEIGFADEGWVVAESEGRFVRLQKTRFSRLSERWIATRPDPYGGQEPAEDDDAGAPAESAVPVGWIERSPLPQASLIRLDGPTLSERFARGRDAPFAQPLTRSIHNETFLLTAPADHDAERPIGLLVWINPTPAAEPPTTVLAAAEMLGLAVIVPANAGNNRPIVDRLQVALDAVATASSTIWIDRDRVYVAGMSGGGRLASMLWAAAPDVFTGAIGIVGLNSHHRVPAGDGKFWPPSHTAPLGAFGRSLRRHPIAAISGPNDFNFIESRARIQLLKRDGYTARLFDIAGLGHTMPGTDAIEQALIWVDRPLIEVRDEAAVGGQRLIEQLPPEVLADPALELTARQQRTLERVTVVAPWTESAWVAARRLGY